MPQGPSRRLAASPRHGEWVTIRTPERDSVVAWVSYPQRTDKAPVVVILHDDTGLSPWHRGVADQLAAEGFIAIAPELLTMRRAGDLTVPIAPDSGRAAIRTIQDSEVNRWVDAVAAYGLGLPAAAESFGVIGFCWGGEQSFRYASVPGGSAQRSSTTVPPRPPANSGRSRPRSSASTAARTPASRRPSSHRRGNEEGRTPVRLRDL
ncbi:MAG: dienelactone hydrolase family protein [Gemmatimonadales bacterium]